ncbi:hypothetical protein [Paraglaciecola sp.]|uniref:hypothetical protein n=1 Tax=Paraglaciecola sp. TaxID=1920173 RepID=UPI00273DA720|nr:hypothetical protein [Paraglaciecola sp.]MDP5032086.1 hypothetical protein [Paraglaciecola sp.]
MVSANTWQQLRPLPIALFISLLFSLVLLGLATHWSFDLFQPGFLWKAYNYYFLSIIDGHLNVPAFAIGKEGSYVGDKVYMYYGILPTLPRFLLHPFVDLTQVPAAYFSIMFYTIIGNTTLQYCLVKQYVCNSKNLKVANSTSFLFLIIVSMVVWFGSGSFIGSQNASIYHEPYAASLCLANIYLGLMLRYNFFTGEYRRISLIPFAILAGLCVHARMPSALALYAVTVILILLQSYRSLKNSAESRHFLHLVIHSISQYYRELIVLLLFGLSIFWLNYVRFGDMFKFMGTGYGFIFFEGWSERQCSVIPSSSIYKFVRVLVNGYVYLTGDWENHWSLIRLLSTGYGRIESPAVPLLLLWPLPIFCFCWLIWKTLVKINVAGNKILLALVFAFSAGAVFQLAYPTITHRYVITLWLPLLASLLYCWCIYLKQEKQFKFQFSAKILVVLALVGVSYQLYIASTSNYYLKDGPVTNLPTYHYSDADNEFLGSLTAEKIEEFIAQRKLTKAAECQKFKELNNLSSG